MCGRAELLFGGERTSQLSPETAKYQLRQKWQLKCGDVPGMGQLAQDHLTVPAAKAGSEKVAEQVKPGTADRRVGGDASAQPGIIVCAHDGAPQLDRSPVVADEVNRLTVRSCSVDDRREIVHKTVHHIPAAGRRGTRGTCTAYVVSHHMELRLKQRNDSIPNRVRVGKSVHKHDRWPGGQTAADDVEVDTCGGDDKSGHVLPIQECEQPNTAENSVNG